MTSTTGKPLPFWAQVAQSLAPKENRVIATVAFVRTFRQGLNGSAIAAAGGGITLTAVGLGEVNWLTVTLAVAAVLITSTGAALTAFFSVLENGLNRKYSEAVVDAIKESGNAPTAAIADAVTDAAASIEKAR